MWNRCRWEQVARGSMARLCCGATRPKADLTPPATACVWSVDVGQYRQLQEKAYLNETGSEAWRLYALLLVYPLASIAQHSYTGLVQRLVARNAALRGAALDAALCLLPLAATFATASTRTFWLFAFSAFSMLSSSPSPEEKEHRGEASGEASGEARDFSMLQGRFRFVAEYRALVMISTCVVILAVDFPSLFPREHAKTETFGYALMDLGTGCIVVASAVSGSRRKGGVRVLGVLFKLWPVLLLGSVRAALLWGIDYHVQVSEYGVHWNFFFTIAAVALASSLLDLRAGESPAAGALLATLYQLYLSTGGGADFILLAPRRGLFSANREGILGCAGYLSLHWLGSGIGALLRAFSPKLTVLLLLAVSSLSALTTHFLGLAGIAVSRRMCNLPYVLHVISLSTWVLALLALADLAASHPRPPISLTLAAVSDSMLAVFLLANLLTGVANLALQPLLVPAGSAFFTLCFYCLLWSMPCAALRAKGRALKFW
ncbi:pigw [Symbiodinium natans]|uniref:Pigw protein n=1 Tax=Symbiodinium natans TaxID=878477 RepID=A0A812JX48_9DINO|nr:pigw [Symbiodinium natans]